MDVSVTAGSFGPEATVVVRVGAELFEIAHHGATPLRWVVDLPGGAVDVLDGYRDASELAAQNGVRNGLMAPFCNRVSGARYTFDGVAQDLLPGVDDRTIYHGLVRELPFTVAGADHDDDGARVTLRCDGLARGTAPGYPYRVEVEAVYTVGIGSLEVEISGTNVGPTAAPFAAGWHPYFRLPGAVTIDGLNVDLPATVAVQTDPALIPHPGGAAFRPLVAGAARWEPIGAAVVDACYAGLDPDGAAPAGEARSVLRDPGSGVQLTLWQVGGLVHLFTGDTLGRDRRASIAIEPVEVMTDAFNRPDCAAAIRLEPGQRRSFRFGVRVELL